jgi:hypothetical protein
MSPEFRLLSLHLLSVFFMRMGELVCRIGWYVIASHFGVPMNGFPAG